MKINVKSSTMVKPMAETPCGTLWLSNFDLLLPANDHTPVVYFYRSNSAANFFDPAVLKAALSRALVEFYPYAGRLKKGENNRLEINCNGEGVFFVEADCDATFDDFGDFASKVDTRLIPAVDYSRGVSTYPLLLAQLTRFKCGGVSLGIADEHHLSDGVSGLHFINSWSEIARGNAISVRPFFDRTLLAARDPPRAHFPHIELQTPPPLITPLPQDHDETIFSIFPITRDQVDTLKAKCNDGNMLNYSTYEVAAGHVWRCVCMARDLSPDQVCRVHIPVDGRTRFRPPLPSGYFGNGIYSAPPIATCGELASNPLSFAVGKIHEGVARLDDEYLRSGIDYLELKGDVAAMARGSHTTRCPNMSINTWVRLPLYEVDFGWGKPVYAGIGATPNEGEIYLMRSPKKNDGSFLYGVTLRKQHMKMFEKLIYRVM